MPDLPLEMHFEIIDHLLLDATRPMQGSESREQADNRAILWACARVSRAFRDRAYSHLFGTVVLEAWLGDGRRLKKAISQLDRAADMLSTAPNCNVIRHIKSFCLFITTNARASTNPDRIQEFIQKGRLQQVFKALHGDERGIKSLSFIVVCNVGPWDYSASTEEFRRAFEELVQSRHLKQVQLRGIAKIPRNIFRGRKIQRVELYGRRFDVQVGDILLSFPLQAIGMDVPPDLELDEVPASLQVVATDSKLEQIYCQVQSAHSMDKVMQFADHTCADTLRTFHVHISGIDFSSALPATGSSPPRKIYHFCRLKQLTTLRISEVVGTEVLHVLRHFLALCSIPSDLGELTLDTAMLLDHGTGAEALPHPERWRLLSQLLTQPTSMFSAIPKIVVIVRFNVLVSIPPSDRAAYNAKVLERLHRSLHKFTAAGMAGRVRDVKINTIFQEFGPYSGGFENSVFARCGGKGASMIPLYPNTW